MFKLLWKKVYFAGTVAFIWTESRHVLRPGVLGELNKTHFRGVTKQASSSDAGRLT